MQEQGPPFDRVRALAASARAALDAGEFQTAFDTATEAIELLAMAYYDPAVIDDTSMRQFAARDQLQKGNLEQAATMISGVLDERLAIHDAKAGTDQGSSSCPNCGATPPPGARFCSQCGQQLSH